ncbi:MAG TPA: HPF/RaiA family ribosome-associated protein [Xanthomonadales bacterium]|nr:HPF/RaiA family ribosome-associated protein [Xanthomonadales bacterium]
MKIFIRTQGFDLTPSLANITQKKFARTLKRYESSISSIELHLKDTNGPKGGKDKQVLARVRLTTGTDIAVEETRADLYRSIGHCARRARRTVRRSLQKSRRLQPEKIRQLRRSHSLTESIHPT